MNRVAERRAESPPIPGRVVIFRPASRPVEPRPAFARGVLIRLDERRLSRRRPERSGRMKWVWLVLVNLFSRSARLAT